MTTIYRYRAVWSAFTGAPGYTAFYSDGTLLPATALHAFFGDLANFLPAGLTITLPTTADQLDDTTGEIIGSIDVIPQPNVVGTAPAGPFAGASGAFIDWRCGAARVAGRQVRGRTFLVPLSASAYDNTGQLSTSTQSGIQFATNDLVSAAAPHLVIWSRPYAGRTDPLPARPARLGSSYPITSGLVPLMQATLRSRRT